MSDQQIIAKLIARITQKIEILKASQEKANWNLPIRAVAGAKR